MNRQWTCLRENVVVVAAAETGSFGVFSSAQNDQWQPLKKLRALVDQL